MIKPIIGPTGQVRIPSTAAQAMADLDEMLSSDFKAHICAYDDGYDFIRFHFSDLGHWLIRYWVLEYQPRFAKNILEQVSMEDVNADASTIAGIIMELYHQHLKKTDTLNQPVIPICSCCGIATPLSRQSYVIYTNSVKPKQRLCETCFNRKYIDGPDTMLWQMLDTAARRQDSVIRKLAAKIERDCTQLSEEGMAGLMGSDVFSALKDDDTLVSKKQKIINNYFKNPNVLKPLADRMTGLAVRGPDPMQDSIDEIRTYMRDHNLGPLVGKIESMEVQDDYLENLPPSYSAQRYRIENINVAEMVTLLATHSARVRSRINLPKIAGYYRRDFLKLYGNASDQSSPLNHDKLK